MKKYPKYKPSNIPWLGDVPEHWEMRKLKYSFKERIQKGFPNETLLAATQTKGVVPKSLYDSRTVLVQKDFHLLKLVKKDDFVISLRSFQGGIERAYFQGIISPAYTIIIPEKNIIPNYFRYLGKSIPFISLLKTCVTGIREGQNIDYNILKRQYLVLPDPTEQIQIARFLDWKVGQINKFIKANKRLLELLNEQKQAIINDAVTGKIDVRTGKPYPKYKPSGVEWLGDIPEDWKVRRLKIVVNNINLQVDTKDNDDQYIAMENVVSWTSEIKISNDDIMFDSKVKKYQIGDILFGKLRPYLAKVTIPTIKGVCVGEFLVLRTRDEIVNNEFLKFKLLTKSIIDLINSSAYGSKMPRASWDFIGNVIISYPALDVQKQIVSYIQEKTQAIDQTVSHIEGEIELIKEYKDRLIADVVTGKVDVRDIEVPEVIEDIEEEILEAENEELEEIEGEE